MEEDLENIESFDNDLDLVLSNVVKDKGGKKEDYVNLLNSIAYHESAGTMNPKIKQYGGGPGRGKYQFENKEGSNRILTSAIRTKNYFKKIGAKVPDFVKSIINKGTEDASNLTSEQQDILALSDLRMKGGLNLSDYVEGKLSIEDLWADHWWSGSKKLRDKKINSFKKSLAKLNKNKIDNNFKLPKQSEINRELNAIAIDNTSVKTPNYKNVNFNNYNPEILKSDFTEFLSKRIAKIEENKKLNEYNNGGTHEENPYGGIPQGIGYNGKPNTVEEGETSFKFGNNKYIFSNRLKL